MPRSSIAAGLLALLLASGPATAQHGVDGLRPVTLAEGLLSGIAHPVMGLDHLVFVLAIGIATAFVTHGWRVAGAFIAMAVTGVALQLAKVALPLTELLVAVSVVVAGCALVASRLDQPRLWTILAAWAGVVHGYALSESIIGAAPAVMASYVIGLVVSLILLVVPAKAVAHLLLIEEPGDGLRVRAAGGAVAALGVVFVTTALLQG